MSGFRLKYWNAPSDDVRFIPFSSAFADMPPATFATREAAEAAADAFVGKYRTKGGDSSGGYDAQDDLYWIRDQVAPDRLRFTQFAIEAC